MKKISLFQFIISIILTLNIYASERSCSSVWNDILDEGELAPRYKLLVNLCDRDFRRSLKRLISNNRQLSYRQAREEFFSNLDNVDGEVCSVYSGRCIETQGIPDHRIMNCEHSWPQSKGAVGIAKSDLHHLFPVMSRMNSRRSNHPFCEVSSASYEGFGSALGTSEYGTRCFEPPDEHKGDLARAMLYFSVRYGKSIDHEQEEYLRKWSNDDHVSDKELNRNNGIERFQGNRNPFIDQPLFMLLITDF